MNINEQLLDLLLKRDLLLQRVSNGLSKEVALYYTDLIKQAINTIKDYDEITIVKMNKLIKEINSKIDYPYSEIEPKFNDLATVEASYIPTGINALVGVDIVNKVLPHSIVQRIINNSYLSDGNTIKEGFSKLDDKLKETFQNQIRLGVLNGETNQQIVNNLKPIMENFTTNNISSLVKTAVSTVTNNTRMEVYKENESVFKGYQHHSVIDSRTTFICSSRDGAFYDLNYKGINEKGKLYPYKPVPLHYLCRSIILPIVKSFKELGLDLEEVSGLTRASMDGEIARTITFTDWFDKKSQSFQEQYLGKGRFELFKQGKINLSNLVNQQGKTLTLEQLKQKYS